MPVGDGNGIIPGCGTHHIAVQTRDWDKSLAFYTEVLGMTQIAEFGSPDRKIVLLDTGDGSHMELFQPTDSSPGEGDPAPNDPVIHFALATSDTRAATEHVRAAGCEITVEPTDVDLGALSVTISFFKGPSDEVIEFFQTN